MFGLIYPYGIALQAIAILHFVRRRPETYWLWIILMFGGVGALINIVRKLKLIDGNTVFMNAEVPAGQVQLKVGKKSPR